MYGLQQNSISRNIDLVLDFPANLIKLLKSGQIDIGLVPVGALLDLHQYQIVSDYCIGTRGEVASVAVFSQVEMSCIEKVLLDYQSRTSVQLCKILFDRYWKKKVEFIDASGEDYLDMIEGNTAGLIIGDRALQYRSRSKFIFDLGSAWRDMTGLPFVFAVWVSQRPMDDEFLKLFNDANALGIASLDKVVSIHGSLTSYDLGFYYAHNIDYKIDDEMMKGISTYLSMLMN